MRIGMPRALYYYDYGLVWQLFFEQLGAEVVISPATTKKMLDEGNNVDEVCLPVKTYLGHAAEISDNVDVLFIPRFISLKAKEYCCPKYLGLPDLVKSMLSHCPPILSVDINMRDCKSAVLKAIITCGSFLGKNAFVSLSGWYKAAKAVQQNAVNALSGKSGLTVGIIGHSYLVNDAILGMHIIERLRCQEISVVVPGSSDYIGSYNKNKELKTVYWTHARRLLEGTCYLISNKMVDGLIFYSVFGCGPDSLVSELVKYKAHENNIPFMMLTVDEHTGEAGFLTRLEAFVDMLKWRLQDDYNFSAYRQNEYSH